MSTILERRQVAWLRANVIARAGDGQEIDPDDLAALPARLRGEVKVLAQHAAAIHASGERGQAQVFAREALGSLAGELGDWDPPRMTPPDEAVLAEIRRAN